MAAANNQITAPRVDFLDQRTGKISREWYMFLYNLYSLTGTGTGVIPVTSGGTGLITIPTNGQLLIGNGTGYTLNTLGTGSGILVTNGAGTITVANTGVLSNIAGTGISVSSATGNVTIANTGVLSFSSGTTGLTPATATNGVITLAGTLIAVNGGTGYASYAVGDLLYADTTTTLAKLADVATGNALISGGVNTAPSWGKIGLTTHVDGVLPIANGGTNGTATPTTYGVSYGTGTAYAFTAAGTTGQILTATTGGAPTWAAPATSGTVTSVGLALPSQFTVTNSPVTGSGTLTGSWNTQTATYVLAGPTTGAAADPTFRALVSTDIPALSYVGSVTGTSPVASSGGLTPAISLEAAYGDTLNPYAAKTANYVLAGPTTGAAAVPAFRALVSTDIPSLSYVSSVTGTAPVVSSGGLTPAISMAAANTSTNGYLTSTDWNTFNSKQPAGTYVTAVSVASSNGFAGTSSGGATPALTLTTSISGVLYGNGTAIAAATISAPLNYSAGTLSITQATTSTNGYLSSTDWNTFNNKGSGSVTNVSFTGGIITVANPTTTPALTVAGTSGGIPYFSSASTWASSAALTQYGVVYGGGAGATPVATAAGTTGQILTATTGGAPTWAAPATNGTVTSVSVVSANGFAGTVATSTTTPAITLSTSITGILKGNGTAISAATSGTDYAPATSGTSILYGNGSGGFSNVTVGSGLSFSAGTLAATTSAPSAPVTKTADFTVAATEVWLINNKSGSTCTVTLPTASTNSGRVLYFQNYQVQTLVSASSNVVPLAGGSAATSILLASSGDSATLVSDGTNWLMTQYIPNNILLLG